MSRAIADIFACASIALMGFSAAPAFSAGSESLQLSDARVTASDKVGIDVPLLMTINNATANADALLRVRCPFANFSEKHTVDRGEGAPAMRAIPSIPIPGNNALALKADGYHVMLLQTRQKLVVGDALACSVTFQKAGTIDTEVRVAAP